MNKKHLGDALDHWKGSVIELLCEKNLRAVENLQVVPMFTDPEPWTKQELGVYAKLLRVKSEDILKPHTLFSNSCRNTYFEFPGDNDLFLDPDTGIAPKKAAKKDHVKPSEIASLLQNSESRMVLVFQYSPRRSNGLKDKLDLLKSSDRLTGCSMFAYDAGVVSMLVISRSQKRIAAARRHLRSWLGPAAKTRIVQ